MIESLRQNRTLRSRTLMGLLAVFIASVLLNRTVDLDHQIETAPALLNEPDLFMTQASISQINEEGHLTSKISADRFTHYPLTDVTTLELPRVALYTPNLTGPWTISSTKGRLLGVSVYRKQSVELWSTVRAEKSNPDGSTTTFITDALNVYPSENVAESDSPVTIFTGNTQTQAAKLRANFDQDTFLFNSNASQRVVTTIRLKP
ncbi:MAG TPA: LPS export ABC transporter periplasmic protein LptC [Gammaproteobacteria bacterium]|jgi:LPS export ABC transporter protein LptC|nr:LPS export ABC transporter periplasmic protein LptC [Gammaproteobacteria bacterium]MDA7590980.1 LPS export ABC transporter periplasmic protein LptC [Pseudomonadales bacterium]MDA8534168.1 LPS export ABC transporter periplasmic protein LptC [Pseudomonadales bacterium]MDB2706371.1 LPS export ABC transporter periplasmic protein LptC [Pseudomonadales bacterium]MDB3977972.1 LPS export ABC transporter periplasmic protein LptC [Pseudomonadales bacterium]